MSSKMALAMTAVTAIITACAGNEFDSAMNDAQTLALKIQALNRLPRTGVELTIDFRKVEGAQRLEILGGRDKMTVVAHMAKIDGDGSVTAGPNDRHIEGLFLTVGFDLTLTGAEDCLKAAIDAAGKGQPFQIVGAGYPNPRPLVPGTRTPEAEASRMSEMTSEAEAVARGEIPPQAFTDAGVAVLLKRIDSCAAIQTVE